MFGEGGVQGIMLMAAHDLFAMIVQQAQKRDKRSYKVDVQFIEVYAPPPSRAVLFPSS